MDFYAGIDGGGTRTRLRCCDEKGVVLFEEKYGPFNLNSIGTAAFCQLLQELRRQLDSLGRCLSLCIGCAGVSNRNVHELVMQYLGDLPQVLLVGDQEIALWGALEGGPGIIVVAGTGSICMGRDVQGATCRVGGWGHLIGDEGSAYGLGRGCLGAVARHMDGWGEETLLTGLLAQQGMHDRQTIISEIYGGDKTRVAALAPLVEQAAVQGDAAALRIISENAEALAAQVSAAARKTGLARPEAAMLGGLLEQDTLFQKTFVEKMALAAPDIRCIPPRQSALMGAVMLARFVKEAVV